MKTIIVEPNQSLRDIAIAYYGTLEALEELIKLNEKMLKNDKTALTHAGIDPRTDSAFYVDVALRIGLGIRIDEISKITRLQVVRNMNTQQTKYQ